MKPLFLKIKPHKRTFLSLSFILLYSITIAYATPPLTPYNSGETLDPSCLPGSPNCFVSVGNSNAFVQDGNSFGVLTTIGTNDSQDLVLETNGLERVRVLASGEVNITNGLTLSSLSTPGILKNNASGLVSSGLVANADVATTAAIAYSKLNLANSIVTGDIVDGTILNIDIANNTIDLTTKVTGILPIANGGTGSSTQNFVDLTTTQTVGGAKTFSNPITLSSLTTGRIPYAGTGGLIQDTSNLSWNNGTGTLGVTGTTSGSSLSVSRVPTSSTNSTAISALAQANANTFSGELIGVDAQAATVGVTGPGTYTGTTLYGVKSKVNAYWGAVPTAYGLYTQANPNFQGFGTYAGLFLAPQSSAGSITNNYGIYQADTTARNYFAGSLTLATTPTTSASTYDLLTRNTTTGAVEKILSSSLPLGTGTTNYLARWTGANTLGIGSIQDDGTNVGIGGAASGAYKLDVGVDSIFRGNLTLVGNIYGNQKYITLPGQGGPNPGYFFPYNNLAGWSFTDSYQTASSLNIKDNTLSMQNTFDLGLGRTSMQLAWTSMNDYKIEPQPAIAYHQGTNLLLKAGNGGVGGVDQNGITGNITLSGGNATGGFANSPGGKVLINGGRGAGSATGGDIIFQTSNTEASGTIVQSLANRMIIKDGSGNVGIGTSTPTKKLEVIGEALIDGWSTSVETANRLNFGKSIGTNVYFANNLSGVGLKVGTGVDGTSRLILQNDNTIIAPDVNSIIFGGGITTNPSVLFRVASTTQGSIPAPVMTTVQKNLIPSPVEGLEVYDLTTHKKNYFDGTAWQEVGNAGWGLTGNASTNPATNFIGTTDAQDFIIKTNGVKVGSFSGDGLGRVALGQSVIASGNTSTALGYFTTASGSASFASGSTSIASGEQSVAMGASFAGGLASFAVGNSTANATGASALGISQALSYGATSFGVNTKAIGGFSIAGGYQSEAQASHTIALGNQVYSQGDYSYAIGRGLTTKSYGETSLGLFNTSYTPTDTTSWIGTDRLISIGNGTADLSRSDAFTILKNGNTGVGTSTPAYKLDINGTTRMQGDTSYNGNLIPLSTANYSLGISSSASGSKLTAYTNGGFSQTHSLEFGYLNTSLNTQGEFNHPSYNDYAFRIYGNRTSNGIGGGIYSEFNIAPTLNFSTATNNGIYYGVNFNPTVSSIANNNIIAFRNTVGDNIFNETSGNTGIGTSTPAYKLDVNGTTNTLGFRMATGAALGKVLTSDATGIATWENSSWNTNGPNSSTGILTLSTGGSAALNLSNSAAYMYMGSGNTFIGHSSSLVGPNGVATQTLGIRTDGGITFSEGAIPYAYFDKTNSLFTNQTSGQSFAVTPSAVLEARSTTQGFLVPRMTTLQRDAIASPANGLQVFNITTNKQNYFDGTSWQEVGNTGWGLNGNTGTNPTTNFIGTTDAQDFVIKTNNTIGMTLSSGGVYGKSITLNGAVNSNLILSTEIPSATLSLGEYGTYTTLSANGKLTMGANRAFMVNGGTSGTDNIVFNRCSACGPGSIFSARIDEGGTDLFVVKNTGNVGIGTSTPAYKLDVGSASVSGIVASFTNSSGSCTINPTAGIACSSDSRLKKNIVSLDDSYLSKIMSLKPVKYNWNNELDTDGLHNGFIAQDLEQVFPDLVATDANGMKSVFYTNLIPYTIKALQEMNIQMTGISNIEKSNTLRDSLVAWLGNAGNGIGNIFSKKIQTDKLCVGQVCVTEQQFLNMVQANNPTPTPAPETPPINTEPEVLPDTEPVTP